MEEDLYCSENIPPPEEEPRGAQIAQEDRYSRQPGRERLNHLLLVEAHVQYPCYFKAVQSGRLTAKDRDHALLRLFQVSIRLSSPFSEEQFQVAVCFCDRYLSKRATRREDLWGVCLGCLLMASKVLGGDLTCKEVAEAGDIANKSLKDSELTVAQGLGWDGTAVTPIEFIRELLCQLHLRCLLSEDLLQRVLEMSVYMSMLFVLDSSKLGIPISTIACVSLMLAVEQVCPTLFPQIRSLILDMTDSELDSFSEYYRAFQTYLSSPMEVDPSEEDSKGCDPATPTTANTPSDARDVHELFK